MPDRPVSLSDQGVVSEKLLAAGRPFAEAANRNVGDMTWKGLFAGLVFAVLDLSDGLRGGGGHALPPDSSGVTASRAGLRGSKSDA